MRTGFNGVFIFAYSQSKALWVSAAKQREILRKNGLRPSKVSF